LAASGSASPPQSLTRFIHFQRFSSCISSQTAASDLAFDRPSLARAWRAEAHALPFSFSALLSLHFVVAVVVGLLFFVAVGVVVGISLLSTGLVTAQS